MRPRKRPTIRARKAMVRPERLFALRAHPFGVALRAINLAGRPSCRTPLLSAGSSNSQRRTVGTRKGFSGKESNGAPGEIRTPGLLVRSQALYPTELRARKGREYYHINKQAPFGSDFEASRRAWHGGEGGIRTLEGLLTLTPLAGARLRPLGHLSGQGHFSPCAERGMIPVRSGPGKAKGV